MSKFDKTIENLRNLGEQLVPYNSDPKHEDSIHVLKKATIDVDGYTVILYFHKCRHGKNFIELLQIMGDTTPFLPFNLIVKIACKVLGGHNLSLVEYYQENHKIYCWSVCVDDRGRPMPYPYNKPPEHCTFQGFEYDYLDPNELYIY